MGEGEGAMTDEIVNYTTTAYYVDKECPNIPLRITNIRAYDQMATREELWFVIVEVEP